MKEYKLTQCKSVHALSVCRKMNVMVLIYQETLRGWFVVFVYSTWLIFTYRICVCSCSILRVNIKTNVEIFGVYTRCRHINPLLCLIYVVTVGKPLLPTFVFQWNELKMQLCVCVCVDISFFIHVRINHCPVPGVCGLDSSRDLLFTPEALLSLFSSLSGCSASPFFSSTEYFKMQKCQHETLNPGHNWTKSWTLKCFYSRRKCFNPPLYCHYLFFLLCLWLNWMYTHSCWSICAMCRAVPHRVRVRSQLYVVGFYPLERLLFPFLSLSAWGASFRFTIPLCLQLDFWGAL